MPRLRKIRTAYSRLLLDASILDMWLVAVSWSFAVTLRPLKLFTRSIVRHGDGSWTDLPRLPHCLQLTAIHFQILFSRLCLDMSYFVESGTRVGLV